MEGRLLGENVKFKKHLTQNIQETKDTMERPNPRVMGLEEGEEFYLKDPGNIFNKAI